jgi:hypothetical protein
VDFTPVKQALHELKSAVDALYAQTPNLVGRTVGDAATRAFNDAILELGRHLIQINYTREGMFRTEPAVKIPPLPDLAPATNLREATGHMLNVTRTHVVRGINRVAWTFETAARAARRAVDEILKQS